MLLKKTTNFGVVLGGIFLAIVIIPTMIQAQEKSPTPTNISSNENSLTDSPPNTNPTHRLIYPRKNQSEEQQRSDLLECYEWTCDQIDWDPHQAYAVLADEGYAVPLTWEEMERGLICQAAQGAVTGSVAGEIVGDAETGEEIGAAIGLALELLRSNYLYEPENPEAERTIYRFEKNLRKWDKKYAGCLVRKGYRVSSN